MSMTVKICGLKTPDSLDTVVKNGAQMAGFNFFPRSPRFVDYELARVLTTQVAGNITRVGLVVDFSDEELDVLVKEVPLDMLQLHGKETPERVAAIRKAFSLPVMKVLSVSEAGDLEAVSAYRPVTDWFMFDAKPPQGSERPGGNAVIFDWTILQGFNPGAPWLLAGGLTPENVADSIRISGTPGVDVASGVESSPGEKDQGRIRAFIHAARTG